MKATTEKISRERYAALTYGDQILAEELFVQVKRVDGADVILLPRAESRSQYNPRYFPSRVVVVGDDHAVDSANARMDDFRKGSDLTVFAAFKAL